MMAKRLDNGNILIPVRATNSDDNGLSTVVGDAWEEISQQDTEYAAWDEWLINYGDLATEQDDRNQGPRSPEPQT